MRSDLFYRIPMLAVIVGLSACAEQAPGPPELTGIEPPLVQVGFKYPYHVFGAHFRDRVIRHTDGDRALSLDQEYTVWVRPSGPLESDPGTSLGETRKEGDQTLEVTGAPLATVGKYDLQVEGPYGESEWLSEKLEVVGAADCASGVPAPLADRQEGVCAGEVKVCQAGAGWVEPGYTEIPGYEATETSCDSKDNDCDGVVDEGCEPASCGAIPPLADKQAGVCVGQVKVCLGSTWVEPDYTAIPGYETTETTCDGKDNDCNGQIDDGLAAPAAARQAGVCAGQKKVCQGTSGWAEPNYTGIPGYEANETSLGDGLDNDCDGLTDVPGLGWTSIPGGQYLMGSTLNSNEQPVHAVSVPALEMTRTEVTVAQYQKCVLRSGCSSPITGGGCNWGVIGKENHPLTCVDWSEAVAFCTWTGGRLPSEAEWEYAARGGGQAITYPWGNPTPDSTRAVYSTSGTMVVCSKTAGNTAQGLCDMAGNVREWVQDWYHSSYKLSETVLAPTDGSAWETPAGTNRVFRNGSWSYDAGLLPASYRSGGNPGTKYDDLGFRCAR